MDVGRLFLTYHMVQVHDSIHLYNFNNSLSVYQRVVYIAWLATIASPL